MALNYEDDYLTWKCIELCLCHVFFLLAHLCARGVAHLVIQTAVVLQLPRLLYWGMVQRYRTVSRRKSESMHIISRKLILKSTLQRMLVRKVI